MCEAVRGREGRGREEKGKGKGRGKGGGADNLTPSSYDEIKRY